MPTYLMPEGRLFAILHYWPQPPTRAKSTALLIYVTQTTSRRPIRPAQRLITSRAAEKARFDATISFDEYRVMI